MDTQTCAQLPMQMQRQAPVQERKEASQPLQPRAHTNASDASAMPAMPATPATASIPALATAAVAPTITNGSSDGQRRISEVRANYSTSSDVYARNIADGPRIRRQRNPEFMVSAAVLDAMPEMEEKSAGELGPDEMDSRRRRRRGGRMRAKTGRHSGATRYR